MSNCDCGCTESFEIECQCENCEFHSSDNRCHASRVKIGPQNAECTHETVCDTFRNR